MSGEVNLLSVKAIASKYNYTESDFVNGNSF